MVVDFVFTSPAINEIEREHFRVGYARPHDRVPRRAWPIKGPDWEVWAKDFQRAREAAPENDTAGCTRFCHTLSKSEPMEKCIKI